MTDVKYINSLSNRLANFKRKSDNVYNFSCPICGDSKHKKNKARGYIYFQKGGYIFFCHNCNASMSLANFIKNIDYSLYREMVLEHIRGNKSKEELEFEEFNKKFIKPKYMHSNALKGLRKVSQLSSDHPIKKLVESRKIPNPYHAKLFACPKFMHHINSIIPNKFSETALKYDEMRLLIPFISPNKDVHALQGRSLKSSSNTKYITIILDEELPKIYGLDTVNFNNTVYVFEGPIDSMFINNSIATAGGDLVSSLKGYDKNNIVIVYDNEPRSKETIDKIDKAIFNGYSVCIWPNNIVHKDINEMILSGLSSEFISYIIKQNTYKDLSAKLALNKWKKI